MSIKGLFLAAAITFSAHFAYAQDQKVAYIDAEAIIKVMPDYKRIESDLTSYKKVLEKQLQAEEKKVQDYYTSVMQQAQAGTMSPKQQQEAEAKLMEMQQTLQQKALDADEQLVKKEQSLTKPLYDKFNAAVKTVAESNGYNYIFDKKMMLTTDGGIDATAKLKTQLGIQ